MKRKLSWEDAQTFLTVSEQGSFSAAARVLGLGQPTISRRIRNLENLLQQQLFERGKHGAVPTPAATRLLPAAEQMAKWSVEFDRTARGTEQQASGIVIIAAPPGIAVEQLGPFAARLKEAAPQIELEILSSVSHVNLTRGAADIAIRTQPPNEPELVALYHASTGTGVFASRAYAETVQQPCSWGDLQWVTWTGQYRDVPPRPMLERLIPDFTPVFASDDYLVQKAAVKAGMGAFIMGDQVGFESNDLVQIDLGITLPASEFYIVCAKSMQQVPRIRLVVEQLIQVLDSSSY